MRWKAMLVIGLGVGYVLGTRAGREQYERLMAMWHSPQVEEAKAGMAAKMDEAAAQASHFVKENAPVGGK